MKLRPLTVAQLKLFLAQFDNDSQIVFYSEGEVQKVLEMWSAAGEPRISLRKTFELSLGEDQDTQRQEDF